MMTSIELAREDLRLMCRDNSSEVFRNTVTNHGFYGGCASHRQSLRVGSGSGATAPPHNKTGIARQYRTRDPSNHPPQFARLLVGSNPGSGTEHLLRNGRLGIVSGPMGSLDNAGAVRIFLKGHRESDARQVHDKSLAHDMDFQLNHG